MNYERMGEAEEQGKDDKQVVQVSKGTSVGGEGNKGTWTRKTRSGNRRPRRGR